MGGRVTYNPSASKSPARNPFRLKVLTAGPAAVEVSAVSRRRTTSLIISLVISVAVLMPQGALAYFEVIAAAPAVSDAGPSTAARAEEEANTKASEEAGAAPHPPEPNTQGHALRPPSGR